jgi:mannose-6-phosphate isomerase-like protein (cupin superfamily)
MNARSKTLLAGLCLVVFATFAVAAAAQEGTQKAGQTGALKWALKVNETRGPVRAADVSSPLGKEVSSQILGGPTNGSDAAYLIFTRMPPGARGPALFTLPDDHLYLVLEGRMTVQIGTDKFLAEPYTGVVIPAGIPHEVSNADAGSEARVFEVIAPGSSRDLMSMLKPAQPRKVENAAQYIRKPKVPGQGELKPGLNGARFAGRDLGSAQQMRIDSTLPGSGGPKPHVHKFQQVYFETEGTTTLTYGLLTYPVPKYSIAIIPPGAVHTNNNKGNVIERHIVLLLNEPADRSEPFDIEVEFKGGVGGTQ